MNSTLAIILKIETTGEADILITAYTELFGKENFVARGARRMEAKLRSDLQPFSLVELSFVRGKNNFLLTGAKTLENFVNGDAIKDFLAVSIISELIDTIIVQPERDERLFLNILLSFRALSDDCSDKNCWLVVHRFFWNLLRLQGVFVNSNKCRQCMNEFSYGASLDFSGELLCNACFKNGIFSFDQEDLYGLAKIITNANFEEAPAHVWGHLNLALKTIVFSAYDGSAFGGKDINPQALSWFLERVI